MAVKMKSVPVEEFLQLVGVSVSTIKALQGAGVSFISTPTSLKFIQLGEVLGKVSVPTHAISHVVKSNYLNQDYAGGFDWVSVQNQILDTVHNIVEDVLSKGASPLHNQINIAIDDTSVGFPTWPPTPKVSIHAPPCDPVDQEFSVDINVNTGTFDSKDMIEKVSKASPLSNLMDKVIAVDQGTPPNIITKKPVALITATELYTPVKSTSPDSLYHLVALSKDGVRVAARWIHGKLSVRMEGSLAKYKDKLVEIGVPVHGVNKYASLHISGVTTTVHANKVIGAILFSMATKWVTVISNMAVLEGKGA